MLDKANTVGAEAVVAEFGTYLVADGDPERPIITHIINIDVRMFLG
jgi:hypothetical protein